MVGRGPAAIPHIHQHDAVVVGAGGAGLYAALELKKELGAEGRVAVISKLYPTRSHTGAAQGGVCAALGNTEEDHWEWHWFDTVKGGDYLVDQDAAEVMCRDAASTIIELEHLGLPFNRTPEGLIDQRRFGGHTRNQGEAPVRRACYAADRTGHAILQTLYQQCIRREVTFADEFQVLDLVRAPEDGSNWLHWWTQSQPIRTAAELPLSFPIVDTRQPFPYQYLAEKAIELRSLGMSASAIARALKVTDKTIAKAVQFAAKIRHRPSPQEG
jgi:aspartate oxidase